MFSFMLVVTLFATNPKKATIPNTNNTRATLMVDVICALNVEIADL